MKELVTPRVMKAECPPESPVHGLIDNSHLANNPIVNHGVIDGRGRLLQKSEDRMLVQVFGTEAVLFFCKPILLTPGPVP